jgi:hypothetical protein
MIAQTISLSALYSVPLKTVCALPQGLDLHFLAQLHSLCREFMWQKLILEYKEMEDHVEDQFQEANNLLKLLEPMHKYVDTRFVLFCYDCFFSFLLIFFLVFCFRFQTI